MKDAFDAINQRSSFFTAQNIVSFHHFETAFVFIRITRGFLNSPLRAVIGGSCSRHMTKGTNLFQYSGGRGTKKYNAYGVWLQATNDEQFQEYFLNIINL